MVIYPVSEHQWENVNWNSEGHYNCINTELGTFYRLLYPSMDTVGGRRQATRSWTHWALKLYTDQGFCQDGVAHMFWVSLVDKFQILIALYIDM
jgi:hypothetical protein